MSYAPSSFCWYEISTDNPAAARAFYSRVMGWQVNDLDMGRIGSYPMLVNGEVPVGGVATAPPGTPNFWNPYIAVDDVDASAAAVREFGGIIHMGPEDIPGVGRFAVAADPQGAVLTLFKSANPEPESVDRAVGGFHWTELWAQDVDAVLPFYKAVFGLVSNPMQMPTGTYHVLEKDGVPCGGAMTSTHADAPPMWLPWVHVADCDATAATATAAGAKLVAEPFDVPGIGRMAIVIDPTGAAIGVIKPAPESMA
jgi:predicted enzyme related to lactoylglutathione lyase